MTDEFIQSQIDYYRKNLNCGPSRVWSQISGLYQYYQGLQNERKRLGLQVKEKSRNTPSN